LVLRVHCGNDLATKGRKKHKRNNPSISYGEKKAQRIPVLGWETLKRNRLVPFVLFRGWSYSLVLCAD